MFLKKIFSLSKAFIVLAAMLFFLSHLAMSTAHPTSMEFSSVENTSEEPDSQEAKINPLTIKDVIDLETAGSFDISPDGKWTAWVKSTSDKSKNRRKQNIYLTSLDDTITVQLTRGALDDRSPQFSPDGTKIAFIRRPPKGQRQIFLLSLKGGEPEKLTDSPTGVRSYAWKDPTTILFAAREDSTFRETWLKKEKDDVLIVADQEHYPPVRLFQIEIVKKETKRLTESAGVILEFSVSPNGRWVVTSENQSIDYTYDRRIPPKQFLLDLEANKRTEIATAPHVDPYDFRWDTGNKGFFCRRDIASDSTNTYVGISQLYYFDLESRNLNEIPLEWEMGLGGPYQIVKDGVVVSLANGVRSRLAHVRRKGNRYEKELLDSPTGHSMRLSAADRNGHRIIYLSSAASTIPEVMTAKIDGNKLSHERKCIVLNESLKKKSLARTEIVKWVGALNDTVEGILYYPLSYEAGKQYPLIGVIHGGPSGVDPDFFTERWTNYPHLLASKGAFAFKVNYHGSGNYGLEWVESIKEHYYEYEVPDILSGINYLIGEMLVDPEKLGIMGWSNGSILAIECCLQDQRFKALCAGAGDVNWASDYGNCAFGAAFDNAYFGGPPWEIPETYVNISPLFRMEQMVAPTLIMFGTEDRNVPTEQGWQHFRAMQQIGKAPVRFLLFPGAKHGLSKLSHRQRKMEEELAWFDKYLFGAPEEKDEALNEESLIALELKKASAKRQGHLLGDLDRTTIIPEVAELEGIKIGRFEVTRAQFRAFDPNYTVPPGTENHPASEISLPLAQAYCMWLSERTGRSFRLPREDEMKKLLKAAESNLGNENNLEYWAGYEATPDERDELLAIIEELEKTRLLIEPAGSFKPVGDQGLYDLGGNVAEWVVDAKGIGKIMGLSAVSSRDRLSVYKRPPLRYVGFRVCEE
ncbi:MAG: prolyl oligopeptidase family serine peptidase [Candidatus Latescibacteria bacterium]|nr:prolyl oligopeptidase family serine peptidase [Candidatus Latescibacterota bacterium]NIM21702.1 prolyl oligopeptidase family serine peptidase [Candidatus Latescibacterota bacterium]NIM65729.1 prolyl oligopeptidase family serine peptidase [Candidatus Latescibacterota bacterium]NIO02115.1 prolyl oligopeptidase family serine peptidase [Candidatus Latescibacterota bacterium]NIO28932.1 prolyl oligopeptidase family serine peptidase [Candidatus Latescibacterota bacterium]